MSTKVEIDFTGVARADRKKVVKGFLRDAFKYREKRDDFGTIPRRRRDPVTVFKMVDVIDTRQGENTTSFRLKVGGTPVNLVAAAQRFFGEDNVRVTEDRVIKIAGHKMSAESGEKSLSPAGL